MQEAGDQVSEYRTRKSIRTLVVDDSPMARGAIRALLQSQPEIELVGFATDGEEGVDQAKDLLPDLILMDLNMPKLDGFSATQRIRRFFPQVRIIIVTVMEGEVIRRACTGIGANGFVRKDRLCQDLFAEIERVFDGHPPGCDHCPITN